MFNVQSVKFISLYNRTNHFDEIKYLFFMKTESNFVSGMVYDSCIYEIKCSNFNMFEIRSTSLVFTSKSCFGTILDSSSCISS